jgi:hypothetical protein
MMCAVIRRLALPLLVTLLCACTSGAGSEGPSADDVGPSVSSGAPASGVIYGRLLAVGGPVSLRRSLPGSVEVSGGGHDFTYRIADAAHGRFHVEVPAGTYSVRGRSPLYQSGMSDCVVASSPVTVYMGGAIAVDVVCVEK